MLNKELLMAVGEGLEPVLSIYFTPGNTANASVRILLSSGNPIEVTGQDTERKTFKFSEIDLTATIFVRYYAYLGTITTKNLVNPYALDRAPVVDVLHLVIEDVTQSASIVIE